MKKSSYSALQCNVPYSPEPGASGVSPMCVVCVLLLWMSCFCLQSRDLQWPSLSVVAGFGPYVVSGTTLGLS